MALLQITFFSEAILKQTSFNVLLPNDLLPLMKEGNPHYDRPMKVLFLLHGLSGNANDWLMGSNAQDLSGKYNLAVVMPSGDNSFYLDGAATGSKYETFIGKELPDYLHKTLNLNLSAENTFIGGLSMGGFGAIHTGLKYPDLFGRIFALSSALVIHSVKNLSPGEDNGMVNYDYCRHVFGDPRELEQSDKNPEYLITQNIKEQIPVRPLYLACGSEDILINENRQFRDFLEKAGVDYLYQESPGIHDWVFWNQYLEPAVRWILEVEE